MALPRHPIRYYGEAREEKERVGNRDRGEGIGTREGWETVGRGEKGKPEIVQWKREVKG